MGNLNISIPQDVRELIAFRVAGNDFCTDIRHVCEIRGWAAVMPMPHAPKFVLGVINLRGTVVPVMDVAARLGFAPTQPSDRNVIIVVSLADQWTGLVVEAVSENIAVGGDQIQPAPMLNFDQGGAVIEGFITAKDNMLTVVSLTHLLHRG